MQLHQLIFFIIGLLVAVPVLVYYYRRPAHRRFRPKLGEMAMVSLFAVLLCGGGAMLVGGFLDDPDQFRVSDDLSVTPGPGAGEVNVESDDGEAGARKSDRRGGRSGERDGGSRGDRRDSGRDDKARRD